MVPSQVAHVHVHTPALCKVYNYYVFALLPLRGSWQGLAQHVILTNTASFFEFHGRPIRVAPENCPPQRPTMSMVSRSGGQFPGAQALFLVSQWSAVGGQAAWSAVEGGRI